MHILFVFLTAQIRFDWQKPIPLEINHSFAIEHITVTDNNILVRDESSQVVHVLEMNGQLSTSLGTTPKDRMVYPYSTSWIPRDRRIYVYDAGSMTFLLWDERGSFVKRIYTKYDRLFRVGKIQSVKDGFIAPVSLAEGRFLLAKLDAKLRVINLGYELVDLRLADVAPVFRQTYSTRIIVSGAPSIIAAQKLSKRVALYDEDLNFIRSMILNTKGWNEAKTKKLEKVTGKPRALERYRETISEIDGLESTGGSEFIIGIRNLSGERVFTYQCYDASNGLPVGAKHETSYRLVGARGKMLFYADTRQERMVLFPCHLITL